MTVWGVVRKNIPKENMSEHVDHYRLNSQLPEVLKSCDYICSVLPSTEDTRGMLSGDVLSACKEKVCRARKGRSICRYYPMCVPIFAGLTLIRSVFLPYKAGPLRSK
jgi:hypothetical protein